MENPNSKSGFEKGPGFPILLSQQQYTVQYSICRGPTPYMLWHTVW